MTYASFFTGIKGACLGLEAAGLTMIWGCEIEPKCQDVIRYHSDVPIYDDVRTLPDVESPDVLWMSPPCQDLSVAGQRKGLAGGKSGLFYDTINAVRRLRQRTRKPDIILMEQVPGLLSSHGGE